MAKTKLKSEIITFKADEALREALKGISNRSEFIRAALKSALDSACPLCGGSGFLTNVQRKHWNEFLSSHNITDCPSCHIHLECNSDSGKKGDK